MSTSKENTVTHTADEEAAAIEKAAENKSSGLSDRGGREGTEQRRRWHDQEEITRPRLPQRMELNARSQNISISM